MADTEMITKWHSNFIGALLDCVPQGTAIAVRVLPGSNPLLICVRLRSTVMTLAGHVSAVGWPSGQWQGGYCELESLWLSQNSKSTATCNFTFLYVAIFPVLALNMLQDSLWQFFSCNLFFEKSSVEINCTRKFMYNKSLALPALK